MTEIYDILQAGQNFNEEKYKSSLEEMLQQCIDYEDGHHIETEWDKWDELVQKGYDCFDEEKPEQGLIFWKDAWDVFLTAMDQIPETYSVDGLLDEQDYLYSVDSWLQDYEMELGNEGDYEERIIFCKKILEIFDWEEEDDSCFQCGIGESLFGQGKVTEAYEHYEKWLTENPQNVNGLISFSWILMENKDAAKAYEMIRKVTWGNSCYVDNELLFMRAKQLADYLGKEDESSWYQQQLDKLDESIRKWEMDEDEIFDEFTMPKRVPVVKDKKIYSNDPCPCGSGKKYKKCCGKV